MDQLWTMVTYDLRQHLRTRAFFVWALGVPLALMLVFNALFSGAQDLSLDRVTVAVSVPAGDVAAQGVVSALTQVDGLEVDVREVGSDEVRERVDDGTADLGIVLPDGFGRLALSGEPVTVDVVEGESAGLETDILVSVTRSVLDSYAAGNVAQRAAVGAGLGLEQVPEVIEYVRTGRASVSFTEGTTSSEQLSGAGSLVAGQAGLFLLFTVGFGVLGLVYERDQGTLVRLRSMPMPSVRVVLAKGMVSFILGTLATAVLLTVGSLLFGVSFGSPATVALLILAAVAASTSIMFVIVRVARTAEQANIAHSITAMALGIAGGAFTPILATGWLATVLDLNPVAAFTHGLGITAGGGGITDLGQPLLHLLGFGVVMLALSRVLPDRGATL